MKNLLTILLCFLSVFVFAEEMSVVIQPWDNPDMPRRAYLRTEAIPLQILLRNPKENKKNAVLLVLQENDEKLYEKKIIVPLFSEKEFVLKESISCEKFKRGIYSISVLWSCGTNNVKTNISVRICGNPYDGGLPVGMWWEAAYKKKGFDEITALYREKGFNALQTMVVLPELLDECLWQGLYCTSITHGNASGENGKRIETGIRLQGSGAPYLLGKNTRWSIANTNWQDAVAKSIGKQVGKFVLHPAYLPYVNTSDDYFHWTGLDYNEENVRKFKLLTERDAPRPSEVLTNAFPLFISHSKGIVADDNEWIQWMRFLCKDVLGRYNKGVTDTVLQETAGRGRIGPVCGGGLEDVMGFVPYADILSGQWPPYNFGNNGFNLLCCYNYNFYKYPSLVQLWWYELGKMENRDLPQWLMPETMDRRKAVHLQNFYLYMAANQKGIMYFIYEQTTEGAWAALQELAPLHKRLGLLFAALKAANPVVGFLMPFEQACFRTQYPVDAQYAFYNLCMAGADIVPVTPQEVEGMVSLKALFLHDIDWITAETLRIITGFIKRGGIVFCDSLCEVPIEGAKKIDFPFGIADRMTGYGNLDVIEKMRNIIPPEIKVFALPDDPHWLVRHFSVGGVDYVWIVNLMTRQEDADHIPVQGAERKVDTLPQYVGIETNTRSTVVTISGKNDFYVVDAVKQKAMATVKTNGVIKTKVQTGTWQGTLLVFYPHLPVRMHAKPLSDAKAGRDFVVDIKIYAADSSKNTVPFSLPLSVKVYNPDGQENREYNQRLMAENGKCKVKIPFALNDDGGIYKLEVIEETTGLATSLKIPLRK